MQAQDVMTTKVVSVAPHTPVAEIAKLLLERQISAVPVVGDDRRLLGIVSEGDLIHELGQDGAPRSWWLDLLASPQARATAYLKSHGRLARDVMTRSVIAVPPDAPLPQIARLLEARRIKRVPVVHDGQLVGIVSRADLLRAFALQPAAEAAARADDRELRERLTVEFEDAGLVWHPYVNIVVNDGIVHLWGIVRIDSEVEALRVAAERIPGVVRVESHLTVRPSLRSL
jgi:CBS domain-containing protein